MEGQRGSTEILPFCRSLTKQRPLSCLCVRAFVYVYTYVYTSVCVFEFVCLRVGVRDSSLVQALKETEAINDTLNESRTHE